MVYTQRIKDIILVIFLCICAFVCALTGENTICLYTSVHLYGQEKNINICQKLQTGKLDKATAATKEIFLSWGKQNKFVIQMVESLGVVEIICSATLLVFQRELGNYSQKWMLIFFNWTEWQYMMGTHWG